MIKAGGSNIQSDDSMSDSYSSSTDLDQELHGFGIDQDTKDNIEKLQSDMGELKEKVNDMMQLLVLLAEHAGVQNPKT